MNLVTMVTVPREGNEPCYHGNSLHLVTIVSRNLDLSDFVKLASCCDGLAEPWGTTYLLQ